jgi:esterase/lipase superfamily enzyme
MRLRWLFSSFLLVSVCLTSSAVAKNAPRITSEPCRKVQNVPVRDTDRKIMSLRTTLNSLTKKQAELPLNAKMQMQQLERRIRTNKEALMELTFARECYRQDLQDDPILIDNAKFGAPSPRGPASEPRSGEMRSEGKWVVITTYYATNRERTGKSNYGSNRAPRLEYGRVDISIPTSRQPGELPLPTLWKLEVTPDPNKHFIVKNIQPLKDDAARAELRSALGSTETKSVLIFVHGFNTAFTDAALRAAQLARDLPFGGLTLFFSWPSFGNTRSYFRDEEMAQLSEPSFNQMLDDIAALGATEVYLIVHSMGSRVVTNALKARPNRAVPNISELLLAAPDINEQIFREQIVPALAAMGHTRRTIYASSNDVALKASNIAHDFRRVGDTTGGVLTFSGYDTIDATLAAPVVRSYGHSYVMDSPQVLKDIADTLLRRKPAAERGLDRQQAPPDTFWLLR